MFMRPVVYRPQDVLICDTDQGVEIVPSHVCGKFDEDTPQEELIALAAPYCEGTIREVAVRRRAIVGRLSAPGFMDCTPWIVGETVQEVCAELVRQFGDDDENGAAFDELISRILADA